MGVHSVGVNEYRSLPLIRPSVIAGGRLPLRLIPDRLTAVGRAHVSTSVGAGP
jgi:hypothetical protein